MTIKGKKNIEYWITRGHRAEIIRVYQIDQPDINPEEIHNPFTVPILVDSMGQGESLADILEERRKLKNKVEELENRIATNSINEWQGLRDRVYTLENKKWWKFWK